MNDPAANDPGANDPRMKGRRNSWRRKLAADRGGSVSVEYVIVIGLLVVLTVALIEASLALWQWNTAEKATELGVRYAVQSNPVVAGFSADTDIGWKATEDPKFGPGDLLNVIKLPPFTVTCTNTSCTCSGCPGGFSTAHDSAAFDAIVLRMDGVFRGSDLGPENVKIFYSHVGVGFAGRPGPDIVPAVTVRLDGVTFNLMILNFLLPLMFFGSEQPTPGAIPMPPFTATLSGEDMYSGGEIPKD